MSDQVLARTIRRCTATVLVALSLRPVMYVARLRGNGVSLYPSTLAYGDGLAWTVLFGSLCYLAGSVGRQALRAAADESESGTRPDARGTGSVAG